MEVIQTIGELLTGSEQRDCIHIAIAPVIASESLSRGADVGLVYGSKDPPYRVKRMRRVYGLPAIGIIDPFLKEYYIEAEQMCWCFLFPGSVVGLRHHWTLPALDEPHVPKSESEEWLRKFADKWNFNYDDMISAVSEVEGYITAIGRDLHGADELDAGDEEQFWHHIQELTGQRFDNKHRKSFGWSCSC